MTSVRIQHNCGKPEWRYCCACNGRIHDEGCTSRKNTEKDCCPKRHKKLFVEGQTLGIADDSIIMWTPEFPWGCHRSEIAK